MGIEVERLLAEARAGRQEAEVEVDEEDLAMDEEEFEELLQELEEEELEEAEAADVRRFERIYEEAAVKPRVLQNRFSPQLGPRSASKLPVRVDATSPRPRRS